MNIESAPLDAWRLRGAQAAKTLREEFALAQHTRMRSSWGSVTYDPKRKVGRIRYWAETPDGYRRLSQTVRGTRKDVEARRAELMLEHSEDAPCPTVGRLYADHFLPTRRKKVESGDMARQTLAQYESNWKCHVGPRWKDVPADQVKPLDVQKWISTLSLNQAKIAKIVLNGVLTYGVRFGYLRSNPMSENYDMPSASTVARREGGCWDAHGLTEVWRACADTWFEAEVLLCGFGSCRVGEGLSVRGTDVSAHRFGDVMVAAVDIDSQILAQTAEDSTTLKNGQSVRISILAGAPARRLVSLALDAGDDYLTSDGLGGSTRQDVVRKCFAARLDEMGVERHLLKNLRKSWRTVAKWDLGLPSEYCEPLMGHAVRGVTGIYYDKPNVKMLGGTFARAYAGFPFADNLPWQEGLALANWDDLGHEKNMHTTLPADLS